MPDNAPDIREFCFSTYAPMDPANMLALWAKTYLTADQFTQFHRMIRDLGQDKTRLITVEQMVTMLDVVTSLY